MDEHSSILGVSGVSAVCAELFVSCALEANGSGERVMRVHTSRKPCAADPLVNTTTNASTRTQAGQTTAVKSKDTATNVSNAVRLSSLHASESCGGSHQSYSYEHRSTQSPSLPILLPTRTLRSRIAPINSLLPKNFRRCHEPNKNQPLARRRLEQTPRNSHSARITSQPPHTLRLHGRHP